MSITDMCFKTIAPSYPGIESLILQPTLEIDFTVSPFSLQDPPSRRGAEVLKSLVLTQSFSVPLPCLTSKTGGA